MFDFLKEHKRIIVTGPHRAGTTFASEIIAEDLGWFDAGEDTPILHDYARKIPGDFEGTRCVLTWFKCKPGRGAFKVTRLEYW